MLDNWLLGHQIFALHRVPSPFILWRIISFIILSTYCIDSLGALTYLLQQSLWWHVLCVFMSTQVEANSSHKHLQRKKVVGIIVTTSFTTQGRQHTPCLFCFMLPSKLSSHSLQHWRLNWMYIGILSLTCSFLDHQLHKCAFRSIGQT